MVNNIKSNLVNYQIKRILKAGALQRNTKNFDEAKSIGILYFAETEEERLQIENLTKDLKAKGKDVQRLTFFVNKKKIPVDFDCNFFTNSEISLLGKIKSENVLSFASIKFDFLFCLYPENIPALDKVAALSNANCRIGPYSEQKEVLLEYMVKFNQDTTMKAKIDTLLHYVNAIKFN